MVLLKTESGPARQNNPICLDELSNLPRQHNKVIMKYNILLVDFLNETVKS